MIGEERSRCLILPEMYGNRINSKYLKCKSLGSIHIPASCFSVTKSCLNFSGPVDCSTSGYPVLHHLLEVTQTHILWVGDAIQPFHPLSPTLSSCPQFSQYQGLFQWVSSLHQMAKVLELQLQHQSFQRLFRVDIFQDTGLISLQSKGFSRVFSSTRVRKHEFFCAQPSLCRQLYIWTSPNGQYQNQIDYILCSWRWRRSIQSAKTRQGVDHGSDHELLIAKFQLGCLLLSFFLDCCCTDIWPPWPPYTLPSVVKLPLVFDIPKCRYKLSPFIFLLLLLLFSHQVMFNSLQPHEL